MSDYVTNKVYIFKQNEIMKQGYNFKVSLLFLIVKEGNFSFYSFPSSIIRLIIPSISESGILPR